MNKIKSFATLRGGLVATFSLVAAMVVLYSCGKTTAVGTAKPTSCVNAHKTVTDSVCNMAGTRPAYQHHWHKVVDSGAIVTNTNTNTSGVNFTVSVAPDKTVSYASYAYTLISTSASVLHYSNTNFTNGNSADLFYYPANDSFVIATVTTTYEPGVTTTEVDTLLSFW